MAASFIFFASAGETALFMIELNNISFSYDSIPALKNITLAIPEGQALAITGPNGCGKSTLLKVLCGIIHPQSGEYLLDGVSINKKKLDDTAFSKAFHRRVGMIFQNPEIQLFCSNVYDEVAFGPRQMGLDEDEVSKRVSDCLSLLCIESLSERQPYHLSGGEKRKVAVASVLSLNPDILLLDEPLNGLDEKTSDKLTDVFAAFKEAGKTIIISTHSNELAGALADRFIKINEEHMAEED